MQLCRTHHAPAGWQCTVCAARLCPDCAAIRTVHPAELIVCALCGELAEPLLLQPDARGFWDHALRAVVFPFTGFGLIGLLMGALALSFGLWVGSLALVLVLGLNIGSLFGVARASGRGSEVEMGDFTHLGTDIAWPLVRFAAATLPAWGCLLLALTTQRAWLVGVGALLALVWCPTAFLGAAAGTPLLTLLNPFAVLRALRDIGATVPKLAAALALLGCASLLTGLLGALLYLLPIPLVSTWAASVVWLYTPWVAARLTGVVLLLHPEPFGWHVEAMPAALPGVLPRGVPPSKAERVVAPIELLEPLAPLPPAHEVLSARFGGGEAEPEPAPLPARAAAMAELELAPMSSHVRAVIADAIAHNDAAAALEGFNATKEVGELDGEQLLWLGRAALSVHDSAAAEHALRLCAGREHSVTSATAMVLMARLLAERLSRGEEALVLMLRVASEFAGTKPGDFATRWLKARGAGL